MPLKPVLLDQKVVGGIGNIYADEIIFESKLTPATRVGDLDEAALARLHAAIQTVLGFAVREGVAEILNGKASADPRLPARPRPEGPAVPDLRHDDRQDPVRRAGHLLPARPASRSLSQRGPDVPELPEVETTARGLRERLLGRQIVTVGSLDWPRMAPNATLETLANDDRRPDHRVDQRGAASTSSSGSPARRTWCSTAR